MMLKRWILAVLAAVAIAVGPASAVHSDESHPPEKALAMIDCLDCNWD